MKDLAGRTAIVTGASRGIGAVVARDLAREGMRVVLAARTTPDLERVAAEIAAKGGRALAVATDVSDLAALERLLEATERELGPPDVLVNNAGIEAVYSYHKLPLAEVDAVVNVNLLAAMRLTRLVLPGMLARRRGHVVNMASLAGKAGPAFSEPYAATKAGLIGFTQSLRASYHGTGVSASVICPGFVNTGMYEAATRDSGLQVPLILGVSKVEDVARAVVRAIVQDLPEAIVNPRPVRPWLALGQLMPGTAERMVRRIGANGLFRQAAEARERQRERGRDP